MSSSSGLLGCSEGALKVHGVNYAFFSGRPPQMVLQNDQFGHLAAYYKLASATCGAGENLRSVYVTLLL